MSEAAAPKARAAFTKGEFYRQCRLWHGYLSAFSFIALLFFSATGVVLNHPDWFKTRAPAAVESHFTLTAAELARVKAAPAPGPVLVEIAAAKSPLKGAFVEAEVAGDDVFARLNGVRGSSDVRGNLRTGAVEVVVEGKTTVAIFNGLHRAENAGKPWRLLVDILGGLLIVMSLVGYILFLSLRFRLRTALVLTGLSLVLMIGLFVLTVA